MADAGIDQRDRRVPLALLITPIVVVSVAAMVGDVVGPTLIVQHPLLQVFLNPRNRWLLLASPHMGPAEFFVVGFVRLLLTDPLGFVLGRQYGDGAIRWAKKAAGDWVDTAIRWFGKAAPVIIFVAPNLYMCILAGASRMKVRTFIVLNFGGTIARLILLRVVGDAFDDQLNSVLDWIRQYQWWLVGLSALVVGIQVVTSRKRGLLETPAEIEADIVALESEDND